MDHDSPLGMLNSCVDSLPDPDSENRVTGEVVSIGEADATLTDAPSAPSAANNPTITRAARTTFDERSFITNQ